MKRDIKSLIMKSLIVAVFLIIGDAVWAQHPLLSDDELNVYVLPNQQQITIGKQAYDEGRTCYKWNGYFSEDGVEERMGSLQVFSRPSYMVENSDFEFHLTVIGELAFLMAYCPLAVQMCHTFLGNCFPWSCEARIPPVHPAISP